VLLSDWSVIEPEVQRVVADGRRAGSGHIFNLGHGVLPETPPEMLTRVVELIRSLGSGADSAGA
jgi:uroporphyrinogen decarboxylase